MTDDLDDLLRPPPEPADTRRDAIFARTAGRLRWAARLRRLRAVAAVGAVFAAGGGVGWFAKPTPAAPPPEVELVPVPVPVPLPADPSPSEPVAALSPDRLELAAEVATDPGESATLYRRAGDAFLARTDIAAAVRCYRIHLATGGPANVAADDSWLLIRLKRATLKETDREPSTGT